MIYSELQATGLTKRAQPAFFVRTAAKRKQWWHPRSPYPPGMNPFEEKTTADAVTAAKSAVVTADPIKLRVTSLGKLPGMYSVISSATNVKGEPWYVSNGNIYALDPKTMKFRNIPFSGSYLGQDNASYNEAKNVIYFQRGRRKEWGGPNFEILDLNTMFAKKGEDNPCFEQRSIVSNGKYVSVGFTEMDAFWNMAVLLHVWDDNAGKWKREIYDGWNRGPPCARREWKLNNIAQDQILVQAHSGRRLEGSDSWTLDTKRYVMKSLETAGLPGRYFEFSSTFPMKVNGKRKIISYGGIPYHEKKGISSDVHVLDLEDNVWEPAPILSGDALKPRAKHHAVAIGDDKVVVFGGQDGEGNTYDDFFLIEANQ
ncbi:hypothetical protein PROFUN_14487 [Planoprotostelium fungivorum]|uniref:Kelch repeat-containing protein n=1 Tax=Planoprotostelium fungivorum TaxID=1890364 RepID=A0A2P6N001_9EUKA|nr:hypothetical protein PROFUN_14487 [Planoprotostelium fungivorum]